MQIRLGLKLVKKMYGKQTKRHSLNPLLDLYLLQHHSVKSIAVDYFWLA